MAKEDRRIGSVADIAFGSTGIADVTAPTAAEVAALTRIECGLVESIDTPRTGNTTDISSLCERETFHIASTVDNAPITGMGWREFDGTDEYWTAFDDTAVPPVTQHLVMCRGGFTSGTPTAGDIVDVYTVQVMHREAVGPNKTEAQRFSFSLAVSNVESDVAIA